MTTVHSTSYSEPATDAIAARADAPPQPEAVLLQMFSGYRIPSLLLQVSKVGIPDLLADGPRSVEDLARETQLDPQALYRVLRLLASNGVFSEVAPRTFRQTPVSDTLRLLRIMRLNLELPPCAAHWSVAHRTGIWPPSIRILRPAPGPERSFRSCYGAIHAQHEHGDR